MITEIILDGEEITDPINLKDLSIGLNFDKDDPKAEVSINQWELGVGDRRKSNDGAVVALNYRTEGLLGGVGVFEGIPYKVNVRHRGERLTVFDGYLDLSKAQYFCDQVIAPAVESGGIDWLNDFVDSFTPERLYEVEKIIKNEDFVPVPYVINSIPDAQNTVITAIGLFVVINEVKDQIQSLAEYVSAASNPFTANIIIAVILRVAYIVLLMAAIVKFLKDLFNLVIQPIKYHMGMYALKTCQRCCEYMGLKFKSSILENTPMIDFLIIPEKFNLNVNDEEKIFGNLKPNKNEQRGYWKGTFGDLLRKLKEKYVAKLILKDGFLMLEPETYEEPGADYILPNVELLSHTLNQEDFISNYLVQYATDMNDKNTIQQFAGTLIQVQTLPIKTNNQKNLLLRNLKIVDLGFSLVKVKTELSFPEKLFDSFFKTIGAILGELTKVVNKLIDLINDLIDTVNKIIKALKTVGIKIKFELKKLKPLETPQISNLISQRLGMMMLENDYISIPKALLVKNNSDPNNNKPLAINQSVLNAVYLYDNYHYVKSFVPREGRKNANQYEIYEVEDVPFTFDDYKKVRNKNKITNQKGEVGKIYSLDWFIEDQKATIRFGINKLYTNNLREVKLIPDGQ